MAKRIMIVDDEPLIIKGLKFSLENDGYEVHVCTDGEEAVESMDTVKPDMILLDVMLPGISGIEVCQRVREVSDVPIIMVTAKGEDMDKILGLEYGADDYMTKPFNILEVKSRIKAVMRRSSNAAPREEKPSMLKRGTLEIDTVNRTAYQNGHEIRLTAKEFDLLVLMASHPGKVYNRNELVSSVWGEDGFKGDERTIDVHIRRVREKTEMHSGGKQYIFTKWGVGYYFAESKNYDEVVD